MYAGYCGFVLSLSLSKHARTLDQRTTHTRHGTLPEEEERSCQDGPDGTEKHAVLNTHERDQLRRKRVEWGNNPVNWTRNEERAIRKAERQRTELPPPLTLPWIAGSRSYPDLPQIANRAT